MEPGTLATVTASCPAQVAGISKADLGWMAAVIDMKGHVTRKSNKSRRTPQLVLVVDVKDSRIARRLAAMTGSTVEVKEHMPPSKAFYRRGCVEHCPDAHVHVDEDNAWQMPEVFRWTATGAAMAIVLVNLAPFMSTYEEHADDVEMALVNMAASGPGSGAVKAAVKRLAGLGWGIPNDIDASFKEHDAVRRQGPPAPASRTGSGTAAGS